MGSSARQLPLKPTADCLGIKDTKVIEQMASEGKIKTSMNGGVKVYHLDFDPKRTPKYLPVADDPPTTP
jgi:hypothetical protein